MTQRSLQLLLSKTLITTSVVGFIVLLTGCASTPPAPKHTQVFTSIEIVDEFDNPKQLGSTTWNPDVEGVCEIKIRKDVYPNCITHEVMHCFSGEWHEGYDTDKYCYD